MVRKSCVERRPHRCETQRTCGKSTREYDLHHFAGNQAAATDVRVVKLACVDVQRAIESKGARSPVIAEGHAGSRMQPARGLSIYFPPFGDPSAFYRELDFAGRTRWVDFLDGYLRNEA